MNSETPWYIQLANNIEKQGGRRNIYRQLNGKSVLYLVRYYIFKDPDGEVMLHNFHLGDFGPLHDHPWDNHNTILQFGYNEHTPDGVFYRPPGYVGKRKAEQPHSVELIPGSEGQVWTMFVTMKRRRKWYFHTENGPIEALEYMKQEGMISNSLPENYSNGIFPTRITA
jgi:hypothetical protein